MRVLFSCLLVFVCLASVAAPLVAQDDAAEKPALEVLNGSLDKRDPEKKHRPLGWFLVDGNKRWGKQGNVTIVKSPIEGGGDAVRIEKTVAEAWYPQLMQQEHVAVEPGKTYRVSAMVQSTTTFNFRYIFMAQGKKTRKRSKEFPASDEMKKVSFTFKVPAGYDQVRLGFHIIKQKGVMVVDNVSIEEAPEAAVVDPMAPGAGEARPHPIHNLVELSRRTRVMPRHLLVSDNTWRSERVVFTDSATGATVLKLTRAPGSTRHQYSNMQPWNADGSMILLRSSRDKRDKFWNYLMDARGTRLTARHYSAVQWCPEHPHRLFFRQWVPDTDLQEVGWWNPFDNTRHVIGRYPKGAIIPPSHDGKKLLMVYGGYSRTRDEPAVGHVVDVETGAYHKISFGFVTHQVWFTKQDDYTVSLNYERKNKHYDPDKHDGSFLIELDGTNLRKVRDRHMSHRGFSPTGRRVAFHHGGIRVMDVEGTNQRVIYRGKGGHLSWQVSRRWVDVTSGNSIRRLSTLDEGFAFRLACPNTQIGFSEYWTEAHLDTSPDGTKVAFASSMLGDTDFYWVVAARPMPVQNLSAIVNNGTVTLTWQRPRRSAELAGYLVYRRNTSGGTPTLLTPTPIERTTFSERLPEAGQAAYVVTMVEHSGLEGAPSQEVRVAADGLWDGPVRHYIEAEHGTPGGSATWHFSAEASNLYGYRAGSAESSTTIVPIRCTAPGEVVVWAKVACPVEARLAAKVGNRSTGMAGIDKQPLGWVKLGTLPVKPGLNDISVVAVGMHTFVDRVFTSTALDDTPLPGGPVDTTAPAPPAAPRPFVRDPYAVALTWLPSPEPDVDHYNVYCSTTDNFRPRQQQLVASPVAPEVIDWGLEHSTVYYYRITAVDRAGNESDPSPQVAITTEAGGQVMLARDVGKPRPFKPVTVRQRTFDEKTLKAMHAWADTRHRLHEDGPLELTVELPHDGRYLVWVKSATVNAGRPAELTVKLNDRRIRWRPAFNFVSIGHGGPTPGVFVWDVVNPTEPDTPRVLELDKGKLTVEISSPAGTPVDIDRVVITDNLGWTPKGIRSWLPGAPGWLDEPVPTMKD